MERNNQDSHLKFLSVLIAVIISFVAWVYVVYNYDPMTKVTYNDVPISFSGEDALADKGYAVARTSAESLYVVLNQKRVDSSKLDAGNITVVADVSEAVEGKNGISLSILSPEGTQVVDSEIRSISVDVEKAERIEVGIEVDYPDNSDINTEPIATNMTSSTATVIGANSSIGSVSRAVAYVGYSDTAEGIGVYTRDLYAVDKNGAIIPHMVIYPGSVNFTADLGYLKKVSLNLNTVDNSDDNYERTVSASDSIVIKGPAEIIEGIDSIDTEELDVTYIYEATDIDLRYNLPEGVYIANSSKGLKAHVTLAEKKTEDKEKSDDKSDSEADAEEEGN